MNLGVVHLIISTHSPRMGRDRWPLWQRLNVLISAHSPRAGRDTGVPPCPTATQHFNPLSPCGERRALDTPPVDNIHISTHSPRTWRDNGRTPDYRIQVISTHSPRMGRDTLPFLLLLRRQDFNPLSPHGERQQIHLWNSSSIRWIVTKNSSFPFIPPLLS